MHDEAVERFVRDGFVKVEGAFPGSVADACVELLWAETGCDPGDPGTWHRPVHWVHDMAQRPFACAAATPVLHDAFDALVGAGRWLPRRSLGSFPLRFPHPEEPEDAGWHVEGSYLPDGCTEYHANIRSRDRALLMLFLFSTVTSGDSPTRIRVGSHADAARVLRRFGEGGASIFAVAEDIERASARRDLALATGRPGDVYLCHPFLVHAAQPHHGTRPRFMAQPPLHPAVPFELNRADGRYSPVERAIRNALT